MEEYAHFLTKHRTSNYQNLRHILSDEKELKVHHIKCPTHVHTISPTLPVYGTFPLLKHCYLI